MYLFIVICYVDHTAHRSFQPIFKVVGYFLLCSSRRSWRVVKRARRSTSAKRKTFARYHLKTKMLGRVTALHTSSSCLQAAL